MISHWLILHFLRQEILLTATGCQNEMQLNFPIFPQHPLTILLYFSIIAEFVCRFTLRSSIEPYAVFLHRFLESNFHRKFKPLRQRNPLLSTISGCGFWPIPMKNFRTIFWQNYRTGRLALLLAILDHHDCKEGNESEYCHWSWTTNHRSSSALFNHLSEIYSLISFNQRVWFTR